MSSYLFIQILRLRPQDDNDRAEVRMTYGRKIFRPFICIVHIESAMFNRLPRSLHSLPPEADKRNDGLRHDKPIFFPCTINNNNIQYVVSFF